VMQRGDLAAAQFYYRAALASHSRVGVARRLPRVEASHFDARIVGITMRDPKRKKNLNPSAVLQV
jgi:hypothetical protein